MEGLRRRLPGRAEYVHQKMETAGVSADLVFDLRSNRAALLTRMHGLAAVLTFRDSPAPRSNERLAAERLLVNRGSSRDAWKTSASPLCSNKTSSPPARRWSALAAAANITLPKRAREYGQMWLAALGGGLLTVLTAAIKMRIIEQQFPLFVEGFLTGTDYAISFILLQVFGLALATKQPSATAATFAGIVRSSRGQARWSRISDFTARITRTQLAAALGNIIAVCTGAVALERLWRVMFSRSYLPAESARHVYQALHPSPPGRLFMLCRGCTSWAGRPDRRLV